MVASLAWKSRERPIFSFWAGKVGKTYTFDKNVGRKSWKLFFKSIDFLYTVKLTDTVGFI